MTIYMVGFSKVVLPKLKSDILLRMDDQKVTPFVMRVLSATFDITDDYMLLEILGSGVGVGGTASKWFTSYLLQRTQQGWIKWILSEKKRLTTGVPHESCLGPMVFTNYVADLFHTIGRHLAEAQRFAVDHQIYLSFRPIPSTNQNDSITVVEDCVSKLRSWMISNMLMVNDSKREFLIVGSIQQSECVNIRFTHVDDDQITLLCQCNTKVWFFTPNWKWIYKSQEAAKALNIISTKSRESENSWAGKTRTRSYTAHKKFMNGFACRGFHPCGAIISTSRCQKTLISKSAK